MADFNRRLKKLEGRVLPKKERRLLLFQIRNYMFLPQAEKEEIQQLCMEKYPEARTAEYVIFCAGPCDESDFSFERDVTLRQ